MRSKCEGDGQVTRSASFAFGEARSKCNRGGGIRCFRGQTNPQLRNEVSSVGEDDDVRRNCVRDADTVGKAGRSGLGRCITGVIGPRDSVQRKPVQWTGRNDDEPLSGTIVAAG